MRATIFGLLAASLTLLAPTSASAGNMGGSDGLDVFSFGQRSIGDPHLHLAGVLGVFPPSIVSFAPPPAPTINSFDPIIIAAPTYVQAAPPGRFFSCGPRIIVIGAQRARRLPTVIYGAPPLGQSY